MSVALLLGGCGPNGPIANATSDLENASDDYGNRTNNGMDNIGNRITPVLERTIEGIDDNGVDAVSNGVAKGPAPNANAPLPDRRK